MNSFIKHQNGKHEVVFDRTFVPFPKENIEGSISKRFEHQVLLHGDRLAIYYQNQGLTYNEVNRWSNKIAHAILNRGNNNVESEPVALLFETGSEMIAAMLGVLKAGKFYVPLDVSLPESRLLQILQDSQAKLILSDRQHLNSPKFEPVISDQDVLMIDTLEEEISEENLDVEVQSNDLAYIIYTSGSTGQPKGVMQNHRYVLNLCRNYTNSGSMNCEDRFSLLYSAAFGGAVRDIYCALLNGAALFPLNVKQIGLHQLGEWLQENDITVMFAVATLFRHFVATLRAKEEFPKLRLIQIGSETVYRQDAELFQKHFAQSATLMVNLGGTEISPIRQFKITKNTAIAQSTVPAGYEVDGTEVLLWDEFGREVAVGEIGEIVVGGCQIAVGYWQKPELTNQAFSDGYFKTGDLGRLLPDGCLQHLGRKDFQVKIRGYRVETNEVEAALLDIESVREAVVVAHADAGGAVGDRLLVAYLTPVNLQNKSAVNELKVALEAKLPSYMIPSRFIWLESLPLTATGKVNRRTLPEPESILSTSEIDLVPPRTATEEILVDIWSEVLNLKPIGIDRNFFECGGHSLHAGQVIARISEKFSIDIPIKLIFEAPTISKLSEYLESSKVRAVSPQLVITPTTRKAKISLSLAQQRLWFLNQLEANKAAYNLLRGFHMTGEVNVPCLEKAIQTIIERHEILRTTFKAIDGSPVQEIALCLPFALSVIDLRDLPLAESKFKVEQIVTELQGWTFDLTEAPLLKAVVIHLNSNEHQFLITMHHIISDDWSMQVFLKELSVLYGEFIKGHATPIEPLPIQYADYTHCQRQWLTGEVLENKLHYWRKQLADSPPLLDLPKDFPRTCVSEQGFQADMVPIKLDRGVTQRLKALSQQAGTTLFVTLLTVFATLLSRYSNQEDVVIGTGIANRNSVAIEQLIGFFVSTLALRIRLADNPTFLDLLDQVHKTVFDSYQNADVPFDRVVDALQIERHPSHTPLFQVMLILQNVTQETLALPGIKAKPLNFSKQTAGATYDLTLSLNEPADGELQGNLEYDTRRFERVTMVSMARYFQNLLKAIVETPEQPIGFLPLLTPQQRNLSIAKQLGDIQPPTQCLHQCFELQVEKTPMAIAVRYENRQLTYQELNERANQLAHYLQSKGVKPDTKVGVCVERSLEMVISILGILKAGAAYVPLDPGYPQSRLAYVAKDARVRIVVTQSWLVDTLPQCEEIVYLDTDSTEIEQQNSSNLVCEVRPDNLAYIIHTSGSTGQPKGVLVTHANVVRLFSATESWYNFNEQDILTQFHSYAFDFSVWEMWGALLHGGRLIIVPHWTSRDTNAFYNLLVSEQVTVLNQTPSAFYQLVEVDRHIKAQLNLRLVIFGGEALDLASVKPWFERHGDRHPQLVNMYGITETTVHVTYRPLSLADVNATDSPIGVPIPDLQIYLLDKYRQAVPRGFRGEMYVGGGGVTRGYLNRPDLTEERFISNPFTSSKLANQDSKLYKTGDLARFLPSGELVYLGRIDNQVKIRGFRIELGEIETLLSQYTAIKESVVQVRADRLGDKQLVAYVVPVNQQALPSNELAFPQSQDKATDSSFIQNIRQYLRQKLPEYMVPKAFVVLERFPLTPNGKIDLRALPAVDLELQIGATYQNPQTELEKQITAIWQKVLRIEKVGIDDNFFEIGGHSLLLVQLHQQLQSALGLDLSIVEMFQYPTIQALAQRVSQNSTSQPANNKDSSPHPLRHGRQALIDQQKQRRQRHRGNKGT